MQQPSDIRKVAFLGDYLPRKCGIATFTTDLRCAVAAEFPAMQCLVVPVNDLAGGYDYPAEVRFEIAEQDLPSYLRAADFLNITDVDVVCVEHEFGIFGGPAGSHVLALPRELRMPIVTTLHTVLREPNAEQRRVMRDLIRLSTRLVVMSGRGRGGRCLPGAGRQDRPHPARHSRHAVPGLELVQGRVRCGGQTGVAHVRSAVARQG
jgi:hypothetical protein